MRHFEIALQQRALAPLRSRPAVGLPLMRPRSPSPHRCTTAENGPNFLTAPLSWPVGSTRAHWDNTANRVGACHVTGSQTNGVNYVFTNGTALPNPTPATSFDNAVAPSTCQVNDGAWPAALMHACMRVILP